MNALRLTAVIGAFAFMSPAVQAQGLLSRFFGTSQPMFLASNTGTCNAYGTCTTNGSYNRGFCGPDGCYVGGRVPASTFPMFQGANNPLPPYFPNGVGTVTPRSSQPGSSYPVNRPPYLGNGLPPINSPFTSPGVMNQNSYRPSRTPATNLNTSPALSGNNSGLNWMFSNPLFTQNNENSLIPGYSLPDQKNGWSLH